MKAEERKEIETNSLVPVLTKAKEFLAGRGGYYVIGSLALIVAIALLWRYMANSRNQVSDDRILRLESADSTKKLKDYMEENKGNVFGSIAKMHLARRSLRSEGLEKLGTDKPEERRQAIASVEQARTYFLELTKELKEKEEPALLQEAWEGAGKAEEALVGLTKEGSSEYLGDINKAIEYYTSATKIFVDSEGTKRLQKYVDELSKNKDTVVAFQKELYKKREQPTLPPLPPLPKPDDKKEPTPMIPSVPTPPTLPMVPLPPDTKKDEPKKEEPKKDEPKKDEGATTPKSK